MSGDGAENAKSSWVEELTRRVVGIRAGRIEGIDADRVFDEELARLEPSSHRRGRWTENDG